MMTSYNPLSFENNIIYYIYADFRGIGTDFPDATNFRNHFTLQASQLLCCYQVALRQFEGEKNNVKTYPRKNILEDR